MIAVPVLTPVTVPVALTVAIAVLLEVHVPPAAVSESVDEVPGQTVVVPVIALVAGNGTTFIDMVTFVAPQILVTE